MFYRLWRGTMPIDPDDDGFSKRPVSAPTLTTGERAAKAAEGATFRRHFRCDKGTLPCWVAMYYDSARSVACFTHTADELTPEGDADGYWEIDAHRVVTEFDGDWTRLAAIYIREKHPAPTIKPFAEIGTVGQ